MRRYLDVIRIDTRRLRWLYCLWLLVLGCRLTLTLGAGPLSPNDFGVGLFRGLDLILAVLVFTLSCLLILEHSPVRTGSPWRTRPLRRSVVLAAKLTSWLLFIALPLLAAKAFTAAHLGLEGWSLLPLLSKDILGGLWFSAIGFAAGALTRRFREALVAAVLVSLAAVWAFSAPNILWRAVSGSSPPIAVSLLIGEGLLLILTIVLAATGAVALLFWTRGRRSAAVAFILCGPFSLGLLTAIHPDLPTRKLLRPVCRGGEIPENPIRLSLRGLHQIELPADAEMFEPEKGKRKVSLLLQASSDVDGIIFRGEFHKARLRWPDGKSRTYLGYIDGAGTFGSPIGVATGAEEVFQDEPFQLQTLAALLGVEPEEVERFGTLPAEYRGTLDLRAERYRVLTELPLEKRARWSGNGFHLTINDIYLGPEGFKLMLTERSLGNFLRVRSFEAFALLNRSRDEVLQLKSLYFEESRSTRTIWGWNEETRISKPVVRFPEGSPIDEDWIRGATLVAFESVCVARPKVSLHLSDIRMADLTHEVMIAKMREVNRRRAEKKAREAQP